MPASRFIRRAHGLMLVLVVGATALPGTAAPPGPHRVTSHGPLDGMAFVGRLGPAGEPGDREDTLYFRAGHFWSAICTPCGFMPAKYWVRRSAAGIHFRGRLTSPESGTFEYSGVLHDDGRITVDINWRKERWYWTIDRAFRFVGSLAEGDPVATLDEARASAESALRSGARCDPRRS